MALFHSVEFLELYRIIPMSMLDRNERLFQDHTFVSHREYVMFQQHQHLLCIRSNQMKSKFPIQIYSPRKFNNKNSNYFHMTHCPEIVDFSWSNTRNDLYQR